MSDPRKAPVGAVLLADVGLRACEPKLRGRDSNPDYLIQSQASYH